MLLLIQAKATKLKFHKENSNLLENATIGGKQPSIASASTPVSLGVVQVKVGVTYTTGLQFQRWSNLHATSKFRRPDGSLIKERPGAITLYANRTFKNATLSGDFIESAKSVRWHARALILRRTGLRYRLMGSVHTPPRQTISAIMSKFEAPVDRVMDGGEKLSGIFFVPFRCGDHHLTHWRAKQCTALTVWNMPRTLCAQWHVRFQTCE